MTHRSLPWLTLAMALLALALIAAPAQAGCPGGRPPSLEVQGQASLDFAPDEAALRLGVITRAQEAAAAGQQNAALMEKVLAALKTALAGKGSIETTGYRINPRYQWDPQNKEQRFLGYEAQNQVVVTTRDLKAVGSLLDAGILAGANNIGGLSWSLSDAAAARAQALAAAYDDAKMQAETLADKAGLKLGPVLKMSTQDSGYNGPQPKTRMMAAAMDANTPVEPGRIAVSARLTCVFALVPKP